MRDLQTEMRDLGIGPFNLARVGSRLQSVPLRSGETVIGKVDRRYADVVQRALDSVYREGDGDTFAEEIAAVKDDLVASREEATDLEKKLDEAHNLLRELHRSLETRANREDPKSEEAFGAQEWLDKIDELLY